MGSDDVNCEDLRESLASYLYGELDDPAGAAVEAHLSSCPTCTTEVAELRRTMRALDLWEVSGAATDEASPARAIDVAIAGRAAGMGRALRWVLPGGVGALAAVLAFAVLVSTQARIERRDGMLEISFYGERENEAMSGVGDATEGEYLLLIMERPDQPVELSGEEEAKRVAEYRDWAGSLRGEGRSIDGQKLTESRYRLASIAGGEVEAVAVATAQNVAHDDVLGGYFRIGAESMDDALAVAKTCPHLRYGGRIEVREVDPRTR